MFLNSLFAEEC